MLLQKTGLWKYHREIIVQLGYDSGHIANPFYPLFYPHRSEYPALFHLMSQKINDQKILNPLCLDDCLQINSSKPIQIQMVSLTNFVELKGRTAGECKII